MSLLSHAIQIHDIRIFTLASWLEGMWWRTGRKAEGKLRLGYIVGNNNKNNDNSNDASAVSDS